MGRGLKPLSVKIEAVWPLCVAEDLALPLGGCSTKGRGAGHGGRVWAQITENGALKASTRTITPVWA